MKHFQKIKLSGWILKLIRLHYTYKIYAFVKMTQNVGIKTKKILNANKI